VPNCVVRRSAYIAPGVVLMPSFVNLGAYVDSGTMVDTWATVGSCAQIGKNCHISGGAGIGGVLEPLQANPVIIEDDCFIGARAEVAEGRGRRDRFGALDGRLSRRLDQDRRPGHGRGLHGAGAALFRRRLGHHAGQAVARRQPGPGLYCAVIVKRVDAKTRSQDQHQRTAARLMQLTDPVVLAQALIRCPSVTPADEGAQAVLGDMLRPLGFKLEPLRFSAGGEPAIDNLFARLGDAAPNLAFAGHTDVVPPGDLDGWTAEPFAAEIRDGWLFGRGVADMKGDIACFVALSPATSNGTGTREARSVF
jgi:hypothetical protein